MVTLHLFVEIRLALCAFEESNCDLPLSRVRKEEFCLDSPFSIHWNGDANIDSSRRLNDESNNSSVACDESDTQSFAQTIPRGGINEKNPDRRQH